MTTIASDRGEFVIRRAEQLGFSSCGFARTQSLDEDAENLRKWLDQGYHGDMTYMENHFELRQDPRRIVPEAKSVIVLTYNYFPTTHQVPEAPKVARYAYGRDYHKVLKKKLKSLWSDCKEHYGLQHGRYFVDSGPVLERVWAEKAGLGWRGKNTLLIHPKRGSYFFLAVLICDLELPIVEPMSDYCGTCTRCIDACPTDAISEEGYVLDASKCISYLTIENKGEIPAEYENLMEGWVFGCDICQEVCPWNRFSIPHEEPDFEAREYITKMTSHDWKELVETDFLEIFQGTPLMRAGYQGLQRNLKALQPEDGPSD